MPNYPAVPQPHPRDPDSVLAAVNALKRGFEILIGIVGPRASAVVTYGTFAATLAAATPAASSSATSEITPQAQMFARQWFFS